MSTTWTITRSVRWRMRDWASCFLACNFPIEEEQEMYRPSPSSPQLPIRNVVFEVKDNSRGSRINTKHSRRNRSNKNRRVNHSPTLSRNTASAERGSSSTDNSSRPHFADEDYIVFCFREDGAFDVVKNGKSEEFNPLDRPSTSSRPLNRKLNYGDENAERVDRSSHQGSPDEDGNDHHPRNGREIDRANKSEEERVVDLDTELASGGMRRRYFQVEESRHSVIEESSDSNQSDGSTGSFAFPVLGWEWSGSPAQMPRSEDSNLRKGKARALRFQCCRF